MTIMRKNIFFYFYFIFLFFIFFIKIYLPVVQKPPAPLNVLSRFSTIITRKGLRSGAQIWRRRLPLEICSVEPEKQSQCTQISTISTINNPSIISQTEGCFEIEERGYI